MATLAAPPADLLDGAALFLDFDGTLVELAETPQAIDVPAALGPLLDRLRRRLGGRVAIVSGRSLADLERHLACPGISVSGSHGAELRLAGGAALPVSVPAGLDEARARVARFAAGTDGVIVEEKPAGIALHYRLAPEREEAALALMEELARGGGFTVQRGSMVAELRPAGGGKGAALRAVMAEPAFVGARPVFVGDDLTDEDGFEAAAAAGGAGVLVGPPRPTAARYRLGSVGAVERWLGEAA
jgi:trehalose 6-phosphate phosphatase